MSEGQDTRTPVLETRGITKIFPGVVANSNINFKLRRRNPGAAG